MPKSSRFVFISILLVLVLNTCKLSSGVETEIPGSVMTAAVQTIEVNMTQTQAAIPSPTTYYGLIAPFYSFYMFPKFRTSGEDADNDYLRNNDEYLLGTDPRNPDTDGDGLYDGIEIYLSNTIQGLVLDPNSFDTDGDGVSDNDEFQTSSSWFNVVSIETPNPTQTIQAAFNRFERLTMKSNIGFYKPEQMKLYETVALTLIISPSMSNLDLTTQLVEKGGLVTSTAEPGDFLMPGGQRVEIETHQIDITPQMKAVLQPHDPDAFTIEEMHNKPEQSISPLDMTVWRWAVTAKKEGTHTLELIIYQLFDFDDKEDEWHILEEYRAEIIVKVALADRIKSLDWKWIIGILVPMILIPAFWRWLDSRKKQASEKKQGYTPE